MCGTRQFNSTRGTQLNTVDRNKSKQRGGDGEEGNYTFMERSSMVRSSSIARSIQISQPLSLKNCHFEGFLFHNWMLEHVRMMSPRLIN